jgi:hypothetical protein
MTLLFKTTYQIVTPQSAENGDYAKTGWISEEGETLRDALQSCKVEVYPSQICTGDVEPDCYPISLNNPPNAFIFYKTNDGTREYYELEEDESRTLHLPENITPASAMRIARLLGVK